MSQDKYITFIQSPRGRALLNTIRHAEGTKGDKGYQTIFGYDYFNDFSKHPNIVNRSSGYASAAAGAYQFMPNTWGMAQKALNLSDFGPRNQDIAASYLIDRRYPISKIMEGASLQDVLPALAPEWASLPTREGKSFYDQPVKSFEELQKVYDTELGNPQTTVSPSNYQTKPQAKPTAKKTSLSPNKFLRNFLMNAINENNLMRPVMPITPMIPNFLQDFNPLRFLSR